MVPPPAPASQTAARRDVAFRDEDAGPQRTERDDVEIAKMIADEQTGAWDRAGRHQADPEDRQAGEADTSDAARPLGQLCLGWATRETVMASCRRRFRRRRARRKRPGGRPGLYPGLLTRRKSPWLIVAGVNDPGYNRPPRSFQEMGAHNHRQRLQVEQGKKTDRAEFTINRRRTTDFRADRQVGTKEFRDVAVRADPGCSGASLVSRHEPTPPATTHGRLGAEMFARAV